MAGRDESIRGTYALAVRDFQATTELELEGLRHRMTSARLPGEDLALLQRLVGNLADGALGRCEEAFPALLDAHIRAGDLDVDGIIKRICTEFVDVMLRPFPGASLYDLVKGGPGPKAQAQRARGIVSTSFDFRVASLRKAVPAYVTQAVKRPPVSEETRRNAAVTLARLYLASKELTISGTTFRDKMRHISTASNVRRAIADSIVPELAVKFGSVDDSFKPTLAGLLIGVPTTVPFVNLTLNFLRRKYQREGHFGLFTWHELNGFREAQSMEISFDCDGAIQIIDVAGLSSGWYGTHWGVPRDLSALLDIPGAYGLLSREVIGFAPQLTSEVTLASGRKLPTDTDVRMTRHERAELTEVEIKPSWSDGFVSVGVFPSTNGKIVLPRKSVFLCHAKEDKEQVVQVRTQLLQDGYIPWYDDHDLVGGDDWERAIEENIEKSDYFVVFLSSRSMSKTGHVHRELRYALQQRDRRPSGSRFIVPVLLDQCTIPRELNRVHFIRFWQAGAYERLTRCFASPVAERELA